MDYTVSETYTLPSLGKIYSEKVNPEVRLRSMTTIEEMKRLSSTDRPYKQLAEIIDDCLIDDVGISSYDMCIGDFQFLLHRLRVVTYGSQYKLTNTCPLCHAINEDIINLDDLGVIEYTDDIVNLVELDLPVTKKHIKLKMQTPRMLDDISVQQKTDKRKAKTSKESASFLYTLKSMIDEIDYQKPKFIELENFVNSLPMMDAQHIMKKGQKLNDSIGVDLTLVNNCEVCGYDYPSLFRITSEFFGPTIDI